MERLDDFLSQGLLPFTGREAETARLFSFWRGTLDAHDLRVALLIGEAGIGKSRLLDEITPRIVEAGGAVIHAKLIPESTTSLLPLIAQGLWYSEIARRLLKSEPEPAHAAVTGALRRVARLRPTLLVLEDIHLLSGDALRELALLVDAVADETLSLLCLARPAELAARAVLQRALVEEIPLPPLDVDELGRLWSNLFGTLPDETTARELHDATGGNPLALRSALRGAVASRAIDVDPRSGRASLAVEAATLARTLRGSVELFVEGMAAHLDATERRAASLLASLGEVLAPETAEALLGDGGAMIARLRSKGILAAAASTLPLLGPSTRPLTFTHTLLHQHLAAEAAPPPERLVALIAAGLPLYSVRPFRIIAAKPAPAMPDDVTVAAFIEQTIAVSFRLDTGPDWMLASEILPAGWRMHEALRVALEGAAPECRTVDRERLLLLEADLLHRTLSSLTRRSASREEIAPHLDRLLELTEPYVSGPMLARRLRALHHLHVATAAAGDGGEEIWERIEDLLATAPELVASDAYVSYLEWAASHAQRAPDPEMLRKIDLRLARMLASGKLSPELKRTALEHVAPSLLQLFDTEEELDRRLRLLRDLPESTNGNGVLLELNRLILLETIGRMEEARLASLNAARRFRELGMERNAAHAELMLLCARAALGTDRQTVERELARFGQTRGYASSPAFLRNAGIYLTEIALLRGEPAWARSMNATLDGAPLSFWSEGAFLVAIDEGRWPEGIEEISEEEEPQRTLRAAGMALLRDGWSPDALDGFRAILARPLLRLDDLLTFHALVAMIDRLGGAAPAGIAGEIHRTAIDALEWLAARKLHPLMAAMVERTRGYLTKREIARWRAEIRSLAAARPTPDAAPETKRAVTMLGAVGCDDGDGRLRPLRGSRVRTMLGLLVAERMLREPLSAREFTAVATGSEILDPELAKKTVIMAVGRLRDAIGAESVITGDQVYHLDLDRVSVDLLEAHRLIKQARHALRRRALLKAYPALREALRITRGEVPFPGLYDEFFEALRDDFEHLLRTTVIDVAGALLREADPASAREILLLAHAALPEDEDISQLLHQALALDGNRIDAERVRMRASEQLEQP